ncbi:hypothetical protein B0O99DRAFT_162464 [Bisporella sp. PMI_857]|nr:hypothetical protein B0O99DRAFT_162464 [Bisporella sp. PMI_857]
MEDPLRCGKANSHARKPRTRTSCLECQRRKQKCDQGHPCRRCMRRFPPAECRYTPKASLAGDTVSSVAAAGNQSNRGIKREELEADFGLCLSDEPGGEREKERLTLQLLHTFARDPGSYQKLLSRMADQITASMPVAGTVGDAFLFRDPRVDGLEAEECARPGDADALTDGWQGLTMADLVGRPSSFGITSVDPLHFLGVKPVARSNELLQIFIKIISKYVFSMDGVVAPNYYNDFWVPRSMKSPLLVHLAIFTSACYCAEAQRINPASYSQAVGYKVKALTLLNEMLQNKQESMTNEALAGVVYFIVNEWYWSCYENVQAHIGGLIQMVRLRGGLDNLGANGFMRKMVILCDYYISCTRGSELSFPHMVHNTIISLPGMTSPFLPSLTQFSKLATKLRIAPQTALVLDDMHFLFRALLAHIDHHAPADQEAKIQKTALWVQNRISSLANPTEPSITSEQGFIHANILTASQIYCRAILTHTSLAHACTVSDLNAIFATMWRVSLTRWKQIPGIFLFAVLSLIQAAQNRPQGRLLKSMFKTASSYVALEQWDVVDGMLMAFWRLARWLDDDGGEGVVVGGREEGGFVDVVGIWTR